MEDAKKTAPKAVAPEAGDSKTALMSEDFFADFNFNELTTIDLSALLKSGAHFGHQKARRNPKMNEYIFGVKNGINIINLEKTAEKLTEAIRFIEKTVSEGQEVLFVGTKKQARDLVISSALHAGMPFVVDRWLGGTFTNFRAIANRTRFLRDSEDKARRGEYAKYTKFEQMKLNEEIEKLNKKMGGIKNMNRLPGAIIATGVIEDRLAIDEARKKNIPVIALTDTNVDPTIIDYPIPANDDAVSSLKLILAFLVKAVLTGKERQANNKNAEIKK